MAKVIYPITWLAGREGEAADVIHDIAVEMMEHRADLHRHLEKNADGEHQARRVYRAILHQYFQPVVLSHWLCM